MLNNIIKEVKGFRLDKKQSNGLQMGGGVVYAGRQQIILECRYPNRKNCHDTISLIPNMGHHINELTDEQAGQIFAEAGWLVKGYNDNKYTRCPYCKTKIKGSPIK